MKRSIKNALLAAAALAIAIPVAHAQNFPDRPVRLILGFAAGGGPDATARVTAQQISTLLGQPVVVENRTGASGVIAVQAVLGAQPDGHTLLVGETGQLGILPHLSKTLPYDTMKDFAPISMLSVQPLVLASSAKSGIKSLQQMIAEARANPGKLAYGSSGVGTLHHLAIEILKSQLGIDMIHVPFKGSGQAMPALLAGDVPLLMSGLQQAHGHARAGKINLLGVTTGARSEFLPEVPSFGEISKGFDYAAEVGLLAPQGTPPAVIKRLSDALRAALQNPDLIAKFKEQYMTPKFSTPEEYSGILRRNLEVYGKVVRTARIPSN